MNRTFVCNPLLLSREKIYSKCFQRAYSLFYKGAKAIFADLTPLIVYYSYMLILQEQYCLNSRIRNTKLPQKIFPCSVVNFSGQRIFGSFLF